MALPFYIQTNASLDRARVRSAAQRQPDALPALVEGDARACLLYFIDGDGAYEAFSGAAYAAPVVRLGLLGAAAKVTVTPFTVVSNGWSFNLPATPVTALFSSTVATVAAAFLEVGVTMTGNRTIFAQLPVELHRAVTA